MKFYNQDRLFYLYKVNIFHVVQPRQICLCLFRYDLSQAPWFTHFIEIKAFRHDLFLLYHNTSFLCPPLPSPPLRGRSNNGLSFPRPTAPPVPWICSLCVPWIQDIPLMACLTHPLTAPTLHHHLPLQPRSQICSGFPISQNIFP